MSVAEIARRTVYDPHAENGIRVDPHFASLIPPLSAAERRSLERSLLAGRGEPLVVWEGQDILVDGHYPFSICQERGILIEVTSRAFANRAEVIAFISAKELTRSNLSAVAVSYLRGKCYLAERQSRGGDQRNEKRATDHNDRLETAQRLASEYKVGEATIRRDGRFAEAVDTICANCGEQARQAILGPVSGVTRKTVVRLATMDPAHQLQFVQKLLIDGKLPRSEASGERKTITLPTEPVSLAERLLKILGTEKSLAVCQALVERLHPSVLPAGQT